MEILLICIYRHCILWPCQIHLFLVLADTLRLLGIFYEQCQFAHFLGDINFINFLGSHQIVYYQYELLNFYFTQQKFMNFYFPQNFKLYLFINHQVICYQYELMNFYFISFIYFIYILFIMLPFFIL